MRTRRAEARNFVQDIGHAGRARQWVAPELGRITLDEWYRPYKSTVVHLRPTTVWLYEREMEHIRPRFGRTPVGKLEPMEIQAWLARLLADGVAPSSVQRRYGLLRRILQVAVNKGIVARSPRAAVDPPRAQTNEMRFLTPTEVVQLPEGLDPWFRPFVCTAVETGMRWSELVGLRRSAVDLLRYRIAITEQLVLHREIATPVASGDGCASSPRPAPASAPSASPSSWLSSWRSSSAPARNRDATPVLVNMRGGPIGGSIFNKRHWQPARQAAGLDGLRFHDTNIVILVRAQSGEAQLGGDRGA
jgi:integrase